jgi:hypothetical protein
VCDACRLPGHPRGGHCHRSADVTGGTTAHKAAADLFGDVKLAPGKSARPGNRVTRTAVPGGLGLKQRQHPLRTVGRPRGHDSPLVFAQGLGRIHTLKCHVSVATQTTGGSTGPTVVGCRGDRGGVPSSRDQLTPKRSDVPDTNARAGR